MWASWLTPSGYSRREVGNRQGGIHPPQPGRQPPMGYGSCYVLAEACSILAQVAAAMRLSMRLLALPLSQAETSNEHQTTAV